MTLSTIDKDSLLVIIQYGKFKELESLAYTCSSLFNEILYDKFQEICFYIYKLYKKKFKIVRYKHNINDKCKYYNINKQICHIHKKEDLGVPIFPKYHKQIDYFSALKYEYYLLINKISSRTNIDKYDHSYLLIDVDHFVKHNELEYCDNYITNYKKNKNICIMSRYTSKTIYKNQCCYYMKSINFKCQLPFKYTINNTHYCKIHSNKHKKRSTQIKIFKHMFKQCFKQNKISIFEFKKYVVTELPNINIPDIEQNITIIAGSSSANRKDKNIQIFKTYIEQVLNIEI